MGTIYAIDKELTKLRDFNLPTNRFSTAIANAYLSFLPTRVYKKHVKYQSLNADGLKLHMFTPNDHKYRPTPVLFYIHGGGFLYKATDIQYHFEQTYAIECGCRVIGIDYSLLPKNKYPIPEDECFAAYKYILDHAEELKIDPENIVFGGDSAGGLLALETFLSVRASRLKEPKGLMLIYPVVDNKCDTDSIKRFTATPVWDSYKNIAMWKKFLDGRQYYSPIDLAPEIKIDNIFIEVEEYDCLHDEGVKLYELVSKKVDNAILLDNKGTFHAFDANTKARICIESVKKRCSFLRGCFGK